MEWTVKNVVPEPDYKLLLTFASGEQRQFDMKPYLDFGVFRTLKDPAMFGSVRVCFSSIAWANNVDVDPETLYTDSIPYPIQTVGQIYENNCQNVCKYEKNVVPLQIETKK